MIRAMLAAALSLGYAAGAAAATINLTGTVRDFCSPAIASTCIDHPDFENGVASETGIVESVLGADKKPVYAKGDGSSSATTHGETAFNQWYNDVAGVNTKTDLTITLDNTITADPDIFTFTDGSFFPIDGALFGNQSRIHNYHFTYEIHSEFTFQGDEVFTFTGDDDLWAFINDILVVDLGGVHSALTGSIDLSDPIVQALLGISVGNVYDFDLFFAERHTVASSFRIDTSLVLEQPEPEPVPAPATLALLGAGLAALGLVRRGRRAR